MAITAPSVGALTLGGEMLVHREPDAAPYAPTWENCRVLLCQNPKNPAPLREPWPKVKNWD